MSRPKFFRDPVHGQIRFEAVNLSLPIPEEVDGNCDKRISWVIRKLIDTKEFQRLRFIRQNGLTNLVFHGAEHSRFSHSLGVSYLAREMHNRIIRNCDDIEFDSLVKLGICSAALLHDVGHGPFSHTLEDALGDFDQKDKFKHEKMTVRYIEEEDSEIFKILSEVDLTFPKEVAAYIDKTKRKEDHWKYKIVSSQLDADRLDYLLRDQRMTGLQGHSFDLPRLLDMLSHVGKQKIAVDKRGLEAVESYLVAIDQMYRAVYFHHAVRSASFLLSSCIRRAFSLYTEGDKSVFPGKHGEVFLKLLNEGSSIPLDCYSTLGEHQIWTLIEGWVDHKETVLSHLAERMTKRNLFKTMEYDPSKGPKKFAELYGKALELAKKNLPKFVTEDTISLFVGFDEASRTSYKRYDWSAEGDDESIYIIKSDHESTPIERFDGTKLLDGLKRTRYYDWLIFPEEIREGLLSFYYS